jgi:hypothetical protein
MKEEDMFLVTEACSPYINETGDLELELSYLENAEEWETNSQHWISKDRIDFNKITSGNNSFFSQYKSSGRHNPYICKVIQLLWSNPSVRSMAKNIGKEV